MFGRLLRLVAPCVGLLALLPLPASADPFLGENPVYAREAGRDKLFYYVASGNGEGQVEYICTADAGSASSATKWQIQKFTYDSSNRVSTIKWADGTDNFTKVCDSRTGYSY